MKYYFTKNKDNFNSTHNFFCLKLQLLQSSILIYKRILKYENKLFSFSFSKNNIIGWNMVLQATRTNSIQQVTFPL